MSVLSVARGWVNMLLGARVENEFDVKPVFSDKMDAFLDKCANIYGGFPYWVDEDIKTINFAKSVCSEVARLTMLGAKVQIGGSARADWLQEQIDSVYFDLREWVEFGSAYGTVILKPNGDSIDFLTKNRFVITSTNQKQVTGAVFKDQTYDPIQKEWFTRLEYHRFLENGKYAVSNRCFVGMAKKGAGKPVAIEKTPWIGMAEDEEIENVERPLFGVLRMPGANNIDVDSALGLPVFSEAIEELLDLDVAYSRNAKEIDASKRIVLMDSDRLTMGGNVQLTPSGQRIAAKAMGLPDYIKMVEGEGCGDIYHEINPSLNTDARLTGINALLSQIGYKCGFSNGYFVFNEKSGVITATQVEADDRRTIQLIKDVRDKLENAIDGLLYALDKMADLYGYAPVGVYETTYDFGDITYNREEDRARWYGYVTAGKVPFWYYLVKFEGFSEEDAKLIEADARPQEPLFGSEE